MLGIKISMGALQQGPGRPPGRRHGAWQDCSSHRPPHRASQQEGKQGGH